MIPFANRQAAGKALAEALKRHPLENPVVVALPRGGVPVAFEVAKALQAPLDILIVKKIGAPSHPEFAIGALAEDDTQPLWSEESISSLDLWPSELQTLADKTRHTLEEQRIKWRRLCPRWEVDDRTVVIVDDGLATGLTMKAAIQALKNRGARKIIVAVPVAPLSTTKSLKEVADEVISLQTPAPFFGVGQWYEDFSQVSDESVTSLLTGWPPKSPNAVQIEVDGIPLDGELTIPKGARGLVIFVHGSGSSHKSPRNQRVAQALNAAGFATLLFDLLSDAESEERSNIFDIELLARRLREATDWARKQSTISQLPCGYFGASTGAAAALTAAAKDSKIAAIVSRGGRPDLAPAALVDVTCPVLLIVGSKDENVREANAQAQKQMRACEMVIIEGAGHLFEEENTLDEVIEHARDWFQTNLVPFVKDQSISTRDTVLNTIQTIARPIVRKDDLRPILESMSSARVVMLGEATHGTEEFYQMRRMISQRLIEDYGFKFIAVEGDWPDCYKLNMFLQGRGPAHARDVMMDFRRWPVWMWANEACEELLDWMKGRGLGFYGLDVYSLYESLDRVKAYLKRFDTEVAQHMLEAYSCLESFDRNEIEYARSLFKETEGCQEEILTNLREILRFRLEETPLLNSELFDLQQNAKILHNADRYYRSMLLGGPESWNIRDEHMIDTLEALMRYHGRDAKAIVWAHNSHIGDYHATDMLSEGYVNLGGLARERFGMEDVLLVGQGTYEGKVLAGRAWEARPEVMTLPPAVAGSYEDYFHKISQRLHAPSLFIPLRGQKALALRKGHRAVGVVYQDSFEPHGKNYVPTELSRRYDSFIFVDKTSALRALSPAAQKGVLPETWPVGI